MKPFTMLRHRVWLDRLTLAAVGPDGDVWIVWQTPTGPQAVTLDTQALDDLINLRDRCDPLLNRDEALAQLDRLGLAPELLDTLPPHSTWQQTLWKRSAVDGLADARLDAAPLFNFGSDQ